MSVVIICIIKALHKISGKFIWSFQNIYTTKVSRITINLSDFSARMRSLRANGKPPAAFEMSNINYAYNGKKYTYAYMARNFDRRDQNAITKVYIS